MKRNLVTYLVVLAHGNDERRYYPSVREATSPTITEDRAYCEALQDWREEFGYERHPRTVCIERRG